MKALDTRNRVAACGLGKYKRVSGRESWRPWRELEQNVCIGIQPPSMQRSQAILGGSGDHPGPRTR